MALRYTRGSAACLFLMLQRLLLLLMARLWLPGSRCASEGRWGSSKPSSPRAPFQQAAITVSLLAVTSSERAGEPHCQLYLPGSNGVNAFLSYAARWPGLEMFVLHLEMSQWVVAAPSAGVAFSEENQMAPWTIWFSSFSHRKRNSVFSVHLKGLGLSRVSYLVCPIAEALWHLELDFRGAGHPGLHRGCQDFAARKTRKVQLSEFYHLVRQNRSRFKYRHAHAEAQVEEKVKMRSRPYRHGIIKALINHLGFALNKPEWNKPKEGVSQFCLTNAKSKPYLIYHQVSKINLSDSMLSIFSARFTAP